MNGFLVLAIETATACGSVSLSRGCGDDFQLLAECTNQQDITHSRRLLGSIQWLMQGTDFDWEDLDAVAVSIGPGSFTGLRIGMAAAKSIVMATACRLVGVSTLDALAYSVAVKKRLLCCLLDARKKEVYACFYRIDEHGMPARLTEPMVVNPLHLLDGIEEPVLLVGPGAKVYRERVRDKQRVETVADYFSSPRAVHVGIVAAEKMARGDIMDPRLAAPVYVRAPEAEVNLKRKLFMQT